MARATSMLLLLVGAMLLVAWLVAPASSAPQSTSRPVDATLDQVLPVLADVNAQVDRLRERLNVPVALPPPVRDPFNYRSQAPRQDAATVRPSLPTAMPEVVADAMPPPLVAILTSEDGQRTAVFAVHDDVRVVSAGDELDAFRVTTIDEDAVGLTLTRTGQTRRVVLR